MINKFIELLKEYNEILKNKIDASRSSKQIYSVLSRLGNEPVSEEEIKVFYDEISKVVLDEETKKRLPFIIFLLKNNKELDETQNGILYSISKRINTQDTSSIESLLEKNNKVIDELSNEEVFKKIEELIIVFSELEASNEIKIDNEFKLGVIREIIKKNHENSSKFEENNSDNKNTSVNDEYVETEVSEDNKMSEEDIRETLEKYGYSYDLLNDKNKKYLLKYATKSNMVDVLEALEKAGLHIKLVGNATISTFCKILVISSSNVIEEYKKICSENGIDIINYALSQLSVLIPNTIKDINFSLDSDTSRDGSMGTAPAFNNFKENVKYLRENGYNFGKIVADAKKTLVINPNILRGNLELLRDVYHIEMYDGDGFSGVQNGAAIEWLDRYIESSPEAYEWIKINHSKTANSSERDIYEIKLGERSGHSLFHITSSTQKIVKYNPNATKTPEEVKEIYKLSDGDLEGRLKITTPEFTGNDIILNIYVNKHLLTRPSSTILSNSFIKLLDQNYRNDVPDRELLYNLGTTEYPTLISRQKVLRVCQILIDKGYDLTEKEIKYALSYNSFLDEKDVENIDRFRFVKKKL